MNVVKIYVCIDEVDLINRVCMLISGNVGDNSCFEYAACYQLDTDDYIFNVGDNSCRGQGSCGYLGKSKFLF